MAVVQQIRAGIADMRQYPAAGDQRHGRDGGAHAGKTTLTFGFATIASCAAMTEVAIIWETTCTSPSTLSCSMCASDRIAMVEAVSPPACPPMPSQMAMRCSPANAESWLLERTVPTSETTVEYMNNCCEAVEVGKNVTSIRRWSHRCAQARARQESSARSDVDD